MAHRRLGRTGLDLSVIGFGAFKIGRNHGIKYAHGYELPDEREVDRLLNGVLDLGINYIDTAPAYGVSEERIGRAISHRKNEFVLSTKVGETFENGRPVFDFTADAIRDSIARSCKRLNVETLDLVFIHSDGNDLRILTQTEVVLTLESLKKQGEIRHIGFSGKTFAGAQAAISGGWADAIMIEYHIDDQSHAPVIADAAKRGVGVIVKKGLASGRLDPQSAIPFILKNPNVTSAVIGGLSIDHIRKNLRIADLA